MKTGLLVLILAMVVMTGLSGDVVIDCTMEVVESPSARVKRTSRSSASVWQLKFTCSNGTVTRVSDMSCDASFTKASLTVDKPVTPAFFKLEKGKQYTYQLDHIDGTHLELTATPENCRYFIDTGFRSISASLF